MVGFATPMNPPIDRHMALEIVSLLRAEGLTRGKSRLLQPASVEVPLDAKTGTEPHEFCEAIKSTHPELPDWIGAAIEHHLQKDEEGHLVIRFPFQLRLVAIKCQHFANTGRMLPALI
jgi:hypothetical protein